MTLDAIPDPAPPPSAPLVDPPPAAARPPSLLAYAGVCTLWAAVAQLVLLPRIVAAPARIPRSLREAAALTALLASIFVGAVFYQAVLRGWVREARPVERFVWIVVAPCAVLAASLAIAGLR